MKIDRIKSLENSAERQFRNYGGFDDGVLYGESTFYNADGVNGAAAVSKINPLAKLYTLVLTNSGDTTQDITILNPGDGTTPSFESIPPGTSVTLKQAQYTRLLTESLNSPKKVLGIKLECKNALQLNNAWTLGYRNAAGRTESFSYSPGSLENSYQNIATRVEDPGFEFDINSYSFITIPVNGTNTVEGGEVLTIYMFLLEEINNSLALQGKPVRAIAPVSYVSGLPQQQIVIEQGATGRLGSGANMTATGRGGL